MGDRDTEHWLRLHGLPYFVRPDARARHLLPRTAPFLVFAVAIDVLSSLVLEVDIDPDTASASEWGTALVALALVVAVPVVPSVLAVATGTGHANPVDAAPGVLSWPPSAPLIGGLWLLGLVAILGQLLLGLLTLQRWTREAAR